MIKETRRENGTTFLGRHLRSQHTDVFVNMKNAGQQMPQTQGKSGQQEKQD
ncbi:MAG: hypothetical protein HC875_02525 [Anaerolineales bacterium]|nr:hypothetical protein [Anaerolineales bacterium]